jgi:TolB-like protein
MKPLLAGILLMATLSALAATPPNLLVVPFHNATGDGELDTFAAGVADLLTACFSAYPEQLGVVDRGELDGIAAEQALGWQGYLASKPLNELGGLSAARYLLRGSVTEQSGELQLEALLFDIHTTRLVHGTGARGGPAALMTRLCDEIAASMAAYVAKAGNTAGPELAVETQPERQQLMIRGLGHYYNGEHAKALPAFLKLADRYPEDPRGQFWLGRGFADAGLPALARVQLRAFMDRFPNDPKHGQAKALLQSLENGSGSPTEPAPPTNQ